MLSSWSNFIKGSCVTNLRDNWNWASRKDTEIHGAAIRITTAVDVTLCWRQVTDTQSSNYRNERRDAEHHNQQVVTAPCHCNVPKIHSYQRSIWFFLLYFQGICEVTISLITPQAGVSPKWLIIWLTWKAICLCSTYKHWLGKLTVKSRHLFCSKTFLVMLIIKIGFKNQHVKSFAWSWEP